MWLWSIDNEEALDHFGAIASWNRKIIKGTCSIFRFKILKRASADFSTTNCLIIVLSKLLSCCISEFTLFFFFFTGIIWLCNYTSMHGFCAYYVCLIYLQYGTLDLSMYNLILRNIYTVRCYCWYTGPLGWDSPAVWGEGVLISFIEERLFIRLEEHILTPHSLSEYLNFRYLSRCPILASSVIAAPLQVSCNGPLCFQ